MDWNNFVFAAIICGMVLLTGCILLFVWGSIQKGLDNRKMRFADKMLQKGKRAMVDVLCESMDILPEKINEVKRTIDEGGV